MSIQKPAEEENLAEVLGVISWNALEAKRKEEERLKAEELAKAARAARVAEAGEKFFLKCREEAMAIAHHGGTSAVAGIPKDPDDAFNAEVMEWTVAKLKRKQLRVTAIDDSSIEDVTYMLLRMEWDVANPQPRRDTPTSMTIPAFEKGVSASPIGDAVLTVESAPGTQEP